MKTVLRALIVGSLVLAQMSPAQWVQTGPWETPQISVAATSDSAIYANGKYGLYKLGLGESKWIGLYRTFPLASGHDAMTQFTARGSVLFGSCSGSLSERYDVVNPYLTISTNSGSSWINMEIDTSQLPPCEAHTTLEIIGSTLLVGAKTGLYISSDTGKTWKKVSNESLQGGIGKLYTDGSTLYSAGRGIYKSTNIGSSWQIVGFKDSVLNMLDVNGARLLAGFSTRNGSGDTAKHRGWLCLSVDGGTNWKTVWHSDSIAPVSITQIANNIYLLASSKRILSSNDTGDSWKDITGVCTGETPLQLYPWGSSIIAIFGNAVFITNDDGMTWSALNRGWTNKSVYSLAVTGPNLLAGIRDQNGGGGIFQSTDNGTNWTANQDVNLSWRGVLSLATSGSRVIAGTYDGVFLSRDNGKQWEIVLGSSGRLEVDAVVIGPNGAGGSNIFAGTWNGRIYRTPNWGTDWTPLVVGSTNGDIRALAVSPNRGGGTNLFAGTSWGLPGVFLSTNNGTSWSATGLTIPVNALAVSPKGARDTNVFAGTDDGVFLSTNNGTSWTLVNTGLTNTVVRSLVVSDSNLIAGTGGGVFLSTNNGTSWSNIGLNHSSVLSLAVSDTYLFAGTGDGVWRIPFAGTVAVDARPMSLDEIQQNLLNNPPNFCDPILREQSLLALDRILTSESDSARWSSSIIGFYTSMMNKVKYELGYSVSKGASIWMMYNDGFVVKTPQVVFAFDLLQGFSNWGTRLPPELVDQIKILFISHLHGDHADSSVANRVKANGGFVVFPAQNSDFGNVPMAAGDTLTLQGLHIRAYDTPHSLPSRIYEVNSVDGTRIVHTGDCKSSEVLPVIDNIDVLLLDAWVNESGTATSIVGMRNCLKRLEPKVMIPGHIYELTPSILRTLLSYEWALDVDDVPLETRVRVMAWGELYTTDEIDTITVGIQTTAFVKRYQLRQNYPNPFNPTTAIEFSIAKLSIVNLKIYNLLGQEVATLVNEVKPAGTHKVNWDASRLSSGVYFYTITAGAYRETKRMILMK